MRGYSATISLVESRSTNFSRDLSQLVREAESLNGCLLDHPRTFSSDSEMAGFFQTFGYVSLKNAIPGEFLASIRQDLMDTLKDYATCENDPVDSAILNLNRIDKKALHVLHLATSKLVSFKIISMIFADILKRISGSHAPFMEIGSGWLLGIAQDSRLVYDFHQEANYMRGFEEVFSVHYPLFRTSSLENGTMSILPGSHRCGTLGFSKSRSSPDSYTDLKPNNIGELLETLPELHCYLDLGDVCIFSKDLVHKSNFNKSSLCRPVGVSRFTQSTVGEWESRSPDDL